MYQARTDRYDTMTYRRCGRSGIALPGVSLGLWHNFGGVDTREEARAMLLHAFDLGVTHFDLANNYGPPPGSAEENFGAIMQSDLAPYRDGGSRKYLLSSLDASLERMGLDYVDIFYHHRPDPDTPLEETAGALDTAVRSGRALYAGISNYYDPELAGRAIEILRSMGTPLLIHQPSYNMFRREIEENGSLTLLEREGVGCITFSPLAWILRHEAVTSVLIGASKVSQIENSVGALARLEFGNDELDAIETALGGWE
ncbi:MAG: aldo/keto reductase [Spirochaetota bacterium]